MRKLFEKADFMPSFTEKRQHGTVRLLFRRRQTAESFHFLIVRARGIIEVNVDTDSNCTTKLILRVNPKALNMLAQLLLTHQIALIIDAKSDFELAFIRETLVDRLNIQVDAIYAFDQVLSSEVLLDISQVITDFHILSDYHRRTFGVSR